MPCPVHPGSCLLPRCPQEMSQRGAWCFPEPQYEEPEQIRPPVLSHQLFLSADVGRGGVVWGGVGWGGRDTLLPRLQGILWRPQDLLDFYPMPCTQAPPPHILPSASWGPSGTKMTNNRCSKRAQLCPGGRFEAVWPFPVVCKDPTTQHGLQQTENFKPANLAP